MGSVNNIQIAPVNVYWRQVQVEEIDFAGLTGSSAKGKYFDISTAKDALLHRVWIDDGVVSDPAAGGRTLVAATISGDSATAAQIAAAVETALDAVTGYKATATGTKVTVSRTVVGQVTLAADGNLGTLSVTQLKKGRDYDLGLLQGDVELNFQPSNLVIQAHQFGVTPLAALSQGFETLEATTTLYETATANLEELYSLYGGAFTPVSGSKIFGAGSVKQGSNLLTEAARLVLKPVNAQNDLQNTNIMLAIPVPGTLVFSGENPRTLQVTWQGFIDTTFNVNANAVAFGDVFQAGVL